MIVTVTLNPGVDLTYDLTDQDDGADVHRAAASTVEASGKGVIVSRVLHAAGVPTMAVLPTAGATGDLLAELLCEADVPHRRIPVAGATRINTTMLMPDHRTTKVNGPGAGLSAADLDLVLEAIDATVAAARVGLAPGTELWLAICGSLPNGVPPEVIHDLATIARRHHAHVAVDVSGPALAAAVAAGADLLAPNDHELAELMCEPDLAGADPDRIGAAARDLASDAAVAEVLVSLGAGGAVHCDGARVLHGTGPVLAPVNTAGAGDALLAGWLAAAGEPDHRLRRALEWGRSACLSPGTADPRPGSRGTDSITISTAAASTSPSSSPLHSGEDHR